MMGFGLPAIGFLLTAATGNDATPEDENTDGFETVVRTSRRAERLATTPFAVSVLDADDIADGRPLQSLGEALNQVPGLLATGQVNGAQDLRLSLRGFGARSTFGVRGLRVFLDGVPLTVPDGQTALDVVDPALIQRIEVLRGPAAALYGSAASAVILLETRGASDEPLGAARGSAGENGHLRGSVAAGQATWSLSASRSQWVGQRERSEFVSQGAVGQLRLSLFEEGDLVVHGLVHGSPRAQDPGGLTAEQLAENRDQAAELNERFRTGENTRQGQLGASFSFERGPHFFAKARVYGQARRFEGRVPFRAIKLRRVFGGAATTWGWRTQLFRFEGGFDTDIQRDSRRNFPNDDGTVQTDASLDQRETLIVRSGWGQTEARFLDGRLRARVAGRFDRYRYRLTDWLTSDGEQSGQRSLGVVSALTGLVWRAREKLSIFASAATAYDVPTLGELAESVNAGLGAPTGLNAELEPSEIRSFELGWRGRIQRLDFETTGFLALGSDEIIAREIGEDMRVFENSGSSRRAGVEASLGYSWRFLDASIQGSLLSSRVGETDRGIPGAATWTSYGQLRGRAPTGWFGAVEVRGQGPVELGSVRSDPSWVTHARAGFRYPTDFGELEWALGVRNAFDVRVIDNFRPNAFGQRFFEPAPGRWFYVGVAVVIDDLFGRENRWN